MSASSPKIEHKEDMCGLKQAIIKHLFEFVSKKPQHEWWRFMGEFNYEGQTYDLECSCNWNGDYFTYHNFHISRKQVVIDIQELQDRGLLQ